MGFEGGHTLCFSALIVRFWRSLASVNSFRLRGDGDSFDFDEECRAGVVFFEKKTALV